MKRILFGALAAFVLLAAPRAQETQGQRGDETKQAKPAHSTMVLTGCLAAGTNASTFKLTKASQVAPPATTAGAATEPPSVGTTGALDEYELSAETALDASSPAVDLKPFVGHQVEVVTRPGDPLPAAPKATALTPTTSADPGKPAERIDARVKVTAIKQVAAMCR
jgi:hypothetical protein